MAKLALLIGILACAIAVAAVIVATHRPASPYDLVCRESLVNGNVSTPIAYPCEVQR